MKYTSIDRPVASPASQGYIQAMIESERDCHQLAYQTFKVTRVMQVKNILK